MTGGFLTRLAERGRGERPATVLPDLPPAYASGLLARAPADFDEIGVASTRREADPADPDEQGNGGRPAGQGQERGLPPDAAWIAPPAATGSGRTAGDDEHARSGGGRATAQDTQEARPAPGGLAAGRPAADAALAGRQQEQREPSRAFAAVGADWGGRLGRPAPVPAVPGDLAAARPGGLAGASTGPRPGDSPSQPPVPWIDAGEAPVTGGPQRRGPREPDVHISIGRIEVRLQEAAAAPISAPRRPRADPAVPLEEYLRRRSGTAGTAG
jgi:hypothetical protein